MSKSLNKLRRQILQAVASAQEGHAPSALSILDLVYCWFSLEHETKRSSDIFLLSKGHASLAMYVVLASFELLDSKELEAYCQKGSKLGGHPDSQKVPQLQISSGSLGHGLPLAVGRAMASQLRGIKRTTFVLIGDGELNEGTNWEALLVASSRKVGGLCVILDANGSNERAIELSDIKFKFKSFGFEVQEINGHDQRSILDSYSWARERERSVIIARTVKGFGVPLMENNPEWHHKFPKISEIDEMLGEL